MLIPINITLSSFTIYKIYDSLSNRDNIPFSLSDE